MVFANYDGSVKAIRLATGKRIVALSLTDEVLLLELADGTTLRLADDEQKCCEKRYMRTDDDLFYLVGAELRGVDVRDGQDISGNLDEDTHEVAFMVVHTDRVDITMSCHNVHNGEYGGFEVSASILPSSRAG